MRGKLLFSAAMGALMGFGVAAPALAQGADQPGDTTTTASVTTGMPVAGALEQAGDTDWFRLSVETGNRYRITLRGAGAEGAALGDPMLVLYDSSGGELNRNDDDGESLNSALSYVPSASGVVFLEARGFAEDATGSYELRVESAEIPPDAIGNDTTTRARLRAGDALAGAIEFEGDTDWYRLDVRNGYSYRISLDSADGDGALGDPLLILHNADGEEIARNDDFESLNSRLTHSPSERGTVYVEARGLSDSDSGAYTISLEEARLPADPQGNNRSTRARVAVGGEATGALEYGGDKDWFRVTLAEGETYRFALRSGSGAEVLDDPMLRLLDADGTELAVDDDSGGNLSSYMEFTAPSSGNYFLEAGGFLDEATGAYVLSAREGDIPGDTQTDVSLSAEGDYREGVLTPGDTDWYSIAMTEGQTVRVGLDAAMQTPIDDPLLVVFGPDGAEIAQDDDSGDGLNSRLEFTAATTGTYYVQAGAFGEESEGRYAVSIMAGEIPGSADGADYLVAQGEGRSSVISAGGDSDWFAVELIEGRPYRFYVDGGPDEGMLADPVLTLYGPNGEQVAMDDDGGMGTNSYLSYRSITGGTYYAAVSAFDQTASGSYFIRAVDTDVPGNMYTDEYLDSENGDDRFSFIDNAGDLDFYQTQLTAQVRYVITVSGEGDTPLADPFLTIVNSSGEDVTSDDDSGPGYDSRLVFTPETTDTYFIKANGLANSIGGYRVTVAREE